MTSRRVVVTGMGAVSAAGVGADLLWHAARDGKPCIGPLEVRQPYGGRIRISAQVRDFDIEARLGPQIAPFADAFTAYALVAADEAIAQAGLDPKERQGPRCAALLGTGIGGLKTIDDGIYSVYFANKRPETLTVPKLIPSAGPSMLSMRYGATGPCFALASACSSGSQAVGLATQMIRAGMIDRAIVGGSEACATNGSMRAWECLRVLTPDLCRPFAKNRNGMVLGEGAAMFVLEAEGAALARGAEPLAVIAGYGTNSDALDPVRPDATSAAACMAMALEDAGLAPQDIDYVNAHGTATVMNDVTEAQGLNMAFDGHCDNLLVSSTKPVHGHGLGAAGALELVISIMALREQIAPPNLNTEIQDPKCLIRLVGPEAVKTNIRAVLSNSLAFGGINASLIVTPFDAA
ncbi:beta-ketoacyl-[acyl-carrier-protein] synthase family protein [Rhodoblastus acidophilus]|uniref:Nodulation protein E n=1 Tax=Candidatus Rhodoblastus alkanivorans TaxID=2954117 RepID=A0ABS9Z3F6_9HYPH|nr:beta-ketoacyl-[acyl-carrier-protein] synthase family protein [Candidatus Rhodoblastus alkanivorans]MCI4679737.1 beta-ketoacyl-[acyl-carrier-protein] synthase family protein [Candidatus Rhodoblastus alkanivorans]MCI4681975.1 beta-ketoacyl-[acyl-carrier-protein] synthase family protein [Candidatus Rhodoblastus alkanivorans]MDI4643026.1 beta-ketoacyl-[acyl-carrier-protein] synthase family protein [Rhodoblastus acidophilus]